MGPWRVLAGEQPQWVLEPKRRVTRDGSARPPGRPVRRHPRAGLRAEFTCLRNSTQVARAACARFMRTAII